MKRCLSITTLLLLSGSLALSEEIATVGNSTAFWDKLSTHCGKAYSGNFPRDINADEFKNQPLVIHVRSCSDNEIKIPFYVGEDRSRTWVFTKEEDDRIRLTHLHHTMDGTEESDSQYGGKATNVGHKNIQIFPADQATASNLPEASTNIWWVTLNKITFSYNLKRVHSDREPLTLIFDVTNPIETPDKPWGWE